MQCKGSILVVNLHMPNCCTHRLALIFTIGLGTAVIAAEPLPGLLMVKFDEVDNSAARQRVLEFLEPHGFDGLTACWRPAYDQCVANMRGAGRAFSHDADECVASVKRLYTLRYSSDADPVELARRLAELPGVEYADPRHPRRTFASPDDPRLGDIGQEYFSFHNLIDAWDVNQGTPEVVIAIVDSGVQYTHTDLMPNIWTNENEIADNSIDDDENGYIDDVYGWDFWHSGPLSAAVEDNDPRPTVSDHGTHVAGIAGAATDNGIGVAGVGWNCRIMAVKAGGTAGSPDSIGFGFEAILYAATNGADIINCSWGGFDRVQSEEDIVNLALALGAVIVAAAGNENIASPLYPAGYPGVVAVGSVSRPTNVKAAISNFGYWIDVMATGDSILSTELNNTYGLKSGTSMASPIVAGVAALLRAQNPEWCNRRIYAQLRATATPVDDANQPSLRHKLGAGRLDALAALTRESPGFRVVGVSLEDNAGNKLGRNIDGVLKVTVRNDNAASVAAVFAAEPLTNGVTVLDDEVAVGVVDSEATAIVDIPVRLDNAVDLTSSVGFILHMRDDAMGYADFAKVDITDLISATIAVNRIETSLNSAGSIGYLDGFNSSGGVGFVPYRGEPNSPGSILFEGGLIIDADGIIIDRVREQGVLSSDFSPLTPFELVQPGIVSEVDGIGSFDSSAKPTAPLLNITLESFVFDQPAVEQTLFLKYTIHNPNPVALVNTFIGLFTDWDIGANPFQDRVAYSAGDSIMYAFNGDDSELPYVAVVPMGALNTMFAIDNGHATAEDPLNFGIYADSGINPNGFTDQEKGWAVRAGLDKTAIGPTDISMTSASGPYAIPAEGDVVAGFIIAYGDDLPDLQAQVAAARALDLFAVSSASELQEQNQRPSIVVQQPVLSSVILQEAPANLVLNVTVTDDNRPAPGALTVGWTTLSGPVAALFADSAMASTTVSFTAAGVYQLRLTANDVLLTAETDFTVVVDFETVYGDGLFAHWKMEGFESTAEDSSPHQRDAALADVGTATAGLVDNARWFNGTDSRGAFTAPAMPRATFAAWLNADAAGNSIFPRVLDMPAYILYWGREAGGEPFRDNTVLFLAEFADEAGIWHTPPSSIGNNKWIHVAVTYSNSDPTNAPDIYIDGVAQEVAVVTEPAGAPRNNAGAGYFGNNADRSRGWDGAIDELRMYNRVLSAAEIAGLHSGPTTNPAPKVAAGDDQVVDLPAPINLAAEVVANTSAAIQWTQISGPGVATFAQSNKALTGVTLSLPGDYVLRVTSNNGQVSVFDELTVTATHDVGLEISDSNVVVDEGRSTQVTVVLASAPLDTLTIELVVTAGDERLSISPPDPLLFSPVDWHAPRTLTLTVAPDNDDDSNGEWQIQVRQVQGLDTIADSAIAVTETDDDLRLTVRQVNPGASTISSVIIFDPVDDMPLTVSAAADPGARLVNWSLTPDVATGEGDRVEILSYGENSIEMVATVDATLDVTFDVADLTLVLHFENAQITELRFGLQDAATDAFDAGIDVIAPDDTGATLAAARLVGASLQSRASEALVHDFREPGGAKRFHLQIDLPDGAPVTEMTWDFSDLEDFREIFLQRQIDERPVAAPIDMKTGGALEINESSVYEIAYAPPASFELDLAAGWNLVSSPVMPLVDLAAVSDDDGLEIWHWDPATVGFRKSSYVNAETGYWVHVDSAESPTVTGVYANGTMHLTAGWQLIGTVGAAVSGLDKPAWYWDPATATFTLHEIDQPLVPGRGYWVWTPADVVIQLPR